MSSIPSLIFIIPYRNRELHKTFFIRNMKHIMSDESKYEIYFSHQIDNRTFNRGAMKNIGFLAIKEKYPDDYKNITFVFNDIDTFPIDKNMLDYRTANGVVKHFYGFRHALGGIVSITGNDFEKINGFPNFWGWGYEDNELNKRVLQANLTIDRSTFYSIMDVHIIQLHNEFKREINKAEIKRYQNRTREGIREIRNLKYSIQKEMINVTNFNTISADKPNTNINHDIRAGNIKLGRKAAMSMMLLDKK